MAFGSAALATVSGGFNHNIPHRGTMFHVQAEVVLKQEGRIDTHVFIGGRILATRRSSLSGRTSSDSVVRAMKDQHRAMVRDLVSDRLTIPAVCFGRAANSPQPKVAAAGPTVAGVIAPRVIGPASAPRPAVENVVQVAVAAADNSTSRAARRVRGAVARLNAILDDDEEACCMRPIAVTIAVLLGADVADFISAEAFDRLKAHQQRLIRGLSGASSFDASMRSECVALGTLLSRQLG